MQSVFAWASSCSDASAIARELTRPAPRRLFAPLFPAATPPMFSTALILRCFHRNPAPPLPLPSSCEPIRSHFTLFRNAPPSLSSFLGWCDKCKLFFSHAAISFDRRLFL
jgi:hypothetical protein